jgi:hypothetical protein
MVDVSGGSTRRIRSHGDLQRVARHGSTAVGDWLEAHSWNDGGVGASLRTAAKQGVGWQRGTALPIVCEGMGPYQREMGRTGLLRRRSRQPLGTIGFLEWDGQKWIDQPEPAFTAKEDWEHGSVYEPNLIYHDGKWRMWYVAGSNHEDYLIQGYAESDDGRTGWSEHLSLRRHDVGTNLGTRRVCYGNLSAFPSDLPILARWLWQPSARLASGRDRRTSDSNGSGPCLGGGGTISSGSAQPWCQQEAPSSL